jgi:hypothetical protein
MVVLFIICFLHALKRRKSYVTEFAVAVVYGVLLEILTMLQLKSYTYGDFLVKIYNAPLAIGIGWALIIYTAMATVDRLKVKCKVRPFVAALLALNIDLSMDAVAIREGFWHWEEHGLWFGVPLGNFFAWFIVVFSFTYFIYRFRKVQTLRNFYPILSMGLSLIVLLVLDDIWTFYLTQPERIFILPSMLLLSTGYAFFNKGRIEKSNKFDWAVILVPSVFHMFFLALLLVREYRMVALILISSLMLMTGLYVHLLPSQKSLKNTYLKPQ